MQASFPTLADQLSQLALNAFRVVLTEQALADAAEADRRRAAGESAPLLGAPASGTPSLTALGHTVTPGNPRYGLRLAASFLPRSTCGLLDWAERVGDGVTLDRRTVANMRMGKMLSRLALPLARHAESAAARRTGAIFDTVDVVLAPTTAQPPPSAHAFDKLGAVGTNRKMIAACPVTWSWNVLGWPSISVPLGGCGRAADPGVAAKPGLANAVHRVLAARDA
jgi:amidase